MFAPTSRRASGVKKQGCTSILRENPFWGKRRERFLWKYTDTNQMCLFFFFFRFLFSCVRLLALTTGREVREIPKSKEHSRPSRSKGDVWVWPQNQSKRPTRQNPSRIAYNEQVASDDRMFVPTSRRASGAKKQGDKTVLQGYKPCKLKKSMKK